MNDRAIAFVALSKGKKPKSSKEIQKTNGYMKQRVSIMVTASIHKLEIDEFVQDHCINPKANWFSRGALRYAIEQAVKYEHTLIIYDLIKLLSNCTQEETFKRWQYLKRLPITIIDAVTTRNLDSFSKRDIISLTAYKSRNCYLTGEVIKLGLKSTNHTSTAPSLKARNDAKRERVGQALAFAKSLEATIDQIIIELKKRNIKPSLQRIADELNEMDVPARRGGQWTSTSVKRVQDRLKNIKKS